MKSSRIVWSNFDLDVDTYKNENKDWIEECYPGCSDDEILELMYDDNRNDLDDERANLDIELDGDIIILASLGLWNGRKPGYKELHSHNVKDCLYSDADYTEWYVDGHKNLKAVAAHHDGTNYYTYRAFKPHISDTQKSNFKHKILDGTITRNDISRMTSSIGKLVSRVYGW